MDVDGSTLTVCFTPTPTTARTFAGSVSRIVRQLALRKVDFDLETTVLY